MWLQAKIKYDMFVAQVSLCLRQLGWNDVTARSVFQFLDVDDSHRQLQFVSLFAFLLGDLLVSRSAISLPVYSCM